MLLWGGALPYNSIRKKHGEKAQLKGTVQQEMDPAKVSSFDRSLLREASWRLFRKIRPSPIEWEPFKEMAPSRTVFAHYALNGQMRSKVYTTLTAPLVKGRMNILHSYLNCSTIVNWKTRKCTKMLSEDGGLADSSKNLLRLSL